MMQSPHSMHSAPTKTDPDEKILQDLSALADQITLCQSMLLAADASGSISVTDSDATDSNEALLAVIGFLEACVPRMVELIEAAASGALGPATFEECLVANDRLTNILADAGKDPKDRRPSAAAAASPAGAASSGDSGTLGGDEADIHQSIMGQLSIGDNYSSDSIVGGGKTTGLDFNDIATTAIAANKSEEDPFAGGLDLLAPTPTPSNPFTGSDATGSSVKGTAAAAADVAAAEKTSDAGDEDDFDAFFKDRTSAT